MTAVVSASGSVQERYASDPYGQSSALAPDWAARAGSTFAWLYLQQGIRFDNATGLYSFPIRDQSPALGRWMEPLPLRVAAGHGNSYRFAGNNPTRLADPSGLTESDKDSDDEKRSCLERLREALKRIKEIQKDQKYCCELCLQRMERMDMSNPSAIGQALTGRFKRNCEEKLKRLDNLIKALQNGEGTLTSDKSTPAQVEKACELAEIAENFVREWNEALARAKRYNQNVVCPGVTPPNVKPTR